MPKLDPFRIASARKLRSTMSDEERILWSQLWRIPVEGTHFRKQSSFGIYCPDFISHRLKLIIEVDGAQHGFDAQIAHDEKRTRWFESQGYRVMRFWTHEVRRELGAVLDTIYAAVEEQRAAAGLTSPSDGGGRGTERSEGHAGGGVPDCGPADHHPTPALRADPPHQGEGKGQRPDHHLTPALRRRPSPQGEGKELEHA